MINIIRIYTYSEVSVHALIVSSNIYGTLKNQAKRLRTVVLTLSNRMQKKLRNAHLKKLELMSQVASSTHIYSTLHMFTKLMKRFNYTSSITQLSITTQENFLLLFLSYRLMLLLDVHEHDVLFNGSSKSHNVCPVRLSSIPDSATGSDFTKPLTGLLEIL